MGPHCIKVVKLLIVVMICALSHHGRGQGVFLFFNASAPTRIGSVDGPLAGPGIWAQMLAGSNFSSLSPVGMPREHGLEGLVGGVVYTTVPTIPAHSYAQVQMVAWDGTLWGTNLASVPSDQLGLTDVVSVFLMTGVFPEGAVAPRFTQPAIVPPIPEPSTLGIAVIACGFFMLRRRVKI
jgi:hypothetical protein